MAEIFGKNLSSRFIHAVCDSEKRYGVIVMTWGIYHHTKLKNDL